MYGLARDGSLNANVLEHLIIITIIKVEMVKILFLLGKKTDLDFYLLTFQP